MVTTSTRTYGRAFDVGSGDGTTRMLTCYDLLSAFGQSLASSPRVVARTRGIKVSRSFSARSKFRGILFQNLQRSLLYFGDVKSYSENLPSKIGWPTQQNDPPANLSKVCATASAETGPRRDAVECSQLTQSVNDTCIQCHHRSLLVVHAR